MLPNPELIHAAGSQPRMTAARRCGIAVRDRWLARPDVAALAVLLADIGDTAMAGPAEFADRLTRWLEDDSWLQALIEDAGQSLRDDPFTAFPFAPIRGRAVHGLALLQAARADLSLSWIDAIALKAVHDQRAMFSSTLSVIRVVRAGGLVVRAHGLDTFGASGPTLTNGELHRLRDGEILHVDNRSTCLSMVGAEADAVLLRFTLRLADGAAHRTFDHETGRQIGTAMADEQVSRMLPLLAVARLAGSAPRAAAVLSELAGHHDAQLRWAAAREWLVADPKAAIAALPGMADGDPDPQVRHAASATLAMVVEQRERAPCPA